MAYGQVIKMHNYVYKTPNKGVLMDLETGTQYSFTRPRPTGEGIITAWNVKLHDIVTFTISNSIATEVTLYRKHLKGKVYSYSG